MPYGVHPRGRGLWGPSTALGRTGQCAVSQFGPLAPRGQHTPLSDPPPLHLPLLYSVLGMPRPTFCHNPKEAHPAGAGALAADISPFVASQSHEALWDLLALPKCTLGAPQRGG